MRLEAVAALTAGGATDLAPLVSTAVNHRPQCVPLAGVDAAANVGEPARRGDKVDEQALAEGAVFSRQDLRNARSPARQVWKQRLPGRVPTSSIGVPPSTVGLGDVLLGIGDVE